MGQKIKNKVWLITYANRLAERELPGLNKLLGDQLKDVFGGVHILPFFNSIDGADAGFDPKDHTQVDPQLGDWGDISKISNQLDIMSDFIVNHMSAESSQFKDLLKKGDDSEFSDLFITFDKVFPEGATEKQLLDIYRPRPNLPFTPVVLDDGKRKIFWTTFSSQQIDIDVNSASGEAYIDNVLKKFSENGVKVIRFDAIGYAIKKSGSRCFMLPETLDFINTLGRKANELGMSVLSEVHAHYEVQVELAKTIGYVYDFALPPLVLHSLYTGDSIALKKWLAIAPRNCVNVLDTHDGIGIIDAGPEGDKEGLLSPEEIDNLVTKMHEKNNGASLKATGAAASNLDLYQVNCTYYEALGRDDKDYLIARAIQFFSPGIPQIYYTGLLAGLNDLDLLEKTSVGRDINRHYYSDKEVDEALKKPVVKGLIHLIRLRNECPAFDGEFLLHEVSEKHLIKITWQLGKDSAALTVDLHAHNFEIIIDSPSGATQYSLDDFLLSK